MAIAFTKVSLPYGWMGNMSPHPVSILDIKFKTAEAAFQASRFGLNFDIIAQIADKKSPFEAKLLAKSYSDKMIVKPCSEDDLHNMEFIVSQKIYQNNLVEELLKTGDEEIYEDVTARGNKGNNCFWGAMLVNGKWIGDNHLGKILMKVRGGYSNYLN